MHINKVRSQKAPSLSQLALISLFIPRSSIIILVWIWQKHHSAGKLNNISLWVFIYYFFPVMNRSCVFIESANQVAKIWPSVAPVELPSDNKNPAAVLSSSQVWMHVDGWQQRALVKGKRLCVCVCVTDLNCRPRSPMRSTWRRGSWRCRCGYFHQTPASSH